MAWRLDRPGLDVKRLIALINTLYERKIGFRTLVETIDTATTTGQFFFHITDAFAEMERNLRGERAMAGLKAARAQGRMGGRPKAIEPEIFAIALKRYGAQKDTVQSICNRLGIARRTFYRYLARHNAGGHIKNSD